MMSMYRRRLMRRMKMMKRQRMEKMRNGTVNSLVCCRAFPNAAASAAACAGAATLPGWDLAAW